MLDSRKTLKRKGKTQIGKRKKKKTGRPGGPQGCALSGRGQGREGGRRAGTAEEKNGRVGRQTEADRPSVKPRKRCMRERLERGGVRNPVRKIRGSAATAQTLEGGARNGAGESKSILPSVAED